MQFDARGMKQTEMFRKLRDILPEFDACVMVEVLVSDAVIAQRIRGFAKMSGYRTTLELRNDYYSVSLCGESCLTCG